jgi:hypothetical protein
MYNAETAELAEDFSNVFREFSAFRVDRRRILVTESTQTSHELSPPPARIRYGMPFKSQAQRRKFAELLVEGKISPQTFEEWNRETGGRKLPERVERKRSSKTTTKKKTTKKKASSRTR